VNLKNKDQKLSNTGSGNLLVSCAKFSVKLRTIRYIRSSEVLHNVGYQRLGATYWCHVQGLSSPRRVRVSFVPWRKPEIVHKNRVFLLCSRAAS
jgi:hypothetical protein